MTGIKHIISDRFWDILQEIDHLEADCPLEVFKERFAQHHVDDESVIEVVQFLKKFDYPVCVKKVAGQVWIKITGERKPVVLEMSFSNWLSLQAHAPFAKDLAHRSFHENLKDCLRKVEQNYPHYDLSRGLFEDKSLSMVPFPKQAVLSKLNNAIFNKEVVLVLLGGQKKFECYPHRMVYVDGDLTFIGEEIVDRCLVSYNFNEIMEAQSEEGKEYRANFSQGEIDDFIYAIRSITGNEERLVLKVTSPENVNLKPDYQFLGNPYVTVNSEGDFIWAASVEVSEELFAWMASIKEDIEVLDPLDIHNQFEEYLQQNKANDKKAA